MPEHSKASGALRSHRIQHNNSLNEIPPQKVQDSTNVADASKIVSDAQVAENAYAENQVIENAP